MKKTKIILLLLAVTHFPLFRICKNDYSGLEGLANCSSSGCVSSWCGNHNLSKRPFSSADCLNKLHISSSSSVPSKIFSEPVKLETSRPHVRKYVLGFILVSKFCITTGWSEFS